MNSLIADAFKKNHILSIIGKVNKLAVVRYYIAERRKVDVARCSRCGMCANICPVGNISMEEREIPKNSKGVNWRSRQRCSDDLQKKTDSFLDSQT